jgi:hypothetical protein
MSGAEKSAGLRVIMPAVGGLFSVSVKNAAREATETPQAFRETRKINGLPESVWWS